MAATSINCKYARNITGTVHCFGQKNMPICENMDRCKLRVAMRADAPFQALSKKEREYLRSIFTARLYVADIPEHISILNKWLTQLENKGEK